MTGPHSHELSMLLRILTLLFFLPTPAAAAERPVISAASPWPLLNSLPMAARVST